MKLANVLKMTCTVFAVAFACQAYAQASRRGRLDRERRSVDQEDGPNREP